MARKPQFRIAAIEDLLRQVRVVSPATRLREMDAAERLIDDLEPDRLYPLEFIVYRITGYRPQGDDSTLVGEALIADLGLFVQELSRTLTVPADYADRRALSLDDVAGRLNVSAKTVQRYRRQGLVCHEVEFEPGASRLACFEDALERFVARRKPQLQRAASFTRVDQETQRRMIDAAQRLRECEGLGLNDAAARLADEFDRAHETVRGVLRRHDREAERPIFENRPPLTAREQRLIGRASRWGVSAAQLAERFHRSAKAIHRVALNERADRLHGMELAYITLSTFERVDAEEVLLSPQSVRTQLDDPRVPGDAIELLHQCRTWPALHEDQEHALLAGYNFLKRRAAQAIDRLDAAPGAVELDAIETDLRWAALLKRRVVALTLPTAVRQVEQTLHRPVSTQPGEAIRQLIDRATSVTSRTIETIDPRRAQRAVRSVAQAMDRALASDPPQAGEGRAAARHAPGELPIEDPLRWLCAWQVWLDRPARWKAHLSALDAYEAQWTALHYGWSGQPPQTLTALAAQYETTTAAVSRAIRRAEARLRRLAIEDENRRSNQS